MINHHIVDLLPYRVFFSIGTPLSANNFLFAYTLSANKKLFADSGVPIEKTR